MPCTFPRLLRETLTIGAGPSLASTSPGTMSEAGFAQMTWRVRLVPDLFLSSTIPVLPGRGSALLVCTSLRLAASLRWLRGPLDYRDELPAQFPGKQVPWPSTPRSKEAIRVHSNFCILVLVFSKRGWEISMGSLHPPGTHGWSAGVSGCGGNLYDWLDSLAAED